MVGTVVGRVVLIVVLFVSGGFVSVGATLGGLDGSIVS